MSLSPKTGISSGAGLPDPSTGIGSSGLEGAAGGGGLTVLIEDSFTDTSGTLMTAHTPEEGTWDALSPELTLEITNNVIHDGNNGAYHVGKNMTTGSDASQRVDAFKLTQSGRSFWSRVYSLSPTTKFINFQVSGNGSWWIREYDGTTLYSRTSGSGHAVNGGTGTKRYTTFNATSGEYIVYDENQTEYTSYTSSVMNGGIADAIYWFCNGDYTVGEIYGVKGVNEVGLDNL